MGINNRKFSRYQLAVLVLYAAALSVFFIFGKLRADYRVSTDHLGSILIFVGLSLAIFFLLFRDRLVKHRIDMAEIFLAIIYALAFAAPEEIIFRGMIQGYLQDNFRDINLSVIFSSLIFGLAHLPNGMTGWRPKEWNWEFAAYAFAAGLPLGLIFALSGSLLVPTFLHALFNLGLVLRLPPETVEK